MDGVQEISEVAGNISRPLLRGRGFQMTLWSDEALNTIRETNPTYMCWAPENAPTTGKFHWQTYVYYKTQKVLDNLRKKVKSIGSVELARGTAEENRTYIFGPYNKKGKEKPANPDAKEVGTLPVQGKRSDLQDFREAIVSGKRGRDLSMDFLEVKAKYPKLEALLSSEEDEQVARQMYRDGLEPEVTVLIGAPGVGKTRYAFDKHGDENIYVMPCGDGCAKSVWWDNYRGQDVIILDDFEGQIQYRYLLRLLDRYPFQMQIKGGYCWRRCTKIYITSNVDIDLWYPAEGDCAALRRRISAIIHL
jgi:hypothetical protein